MKLLYPTSLALDTKSIEGFPLTLHAYDVKKPIPDDLIDAEVLVTWSNSADNLSDAKKRMENVKFIQSLAAGPNDVLNAGFDPKEVHICTGSGLHDHTVAEHALGMLLNAARRFYEMRDYQNQGKWAAHLGGSQPDRPKDKFTTLRDAKVTIWGYGNIAKCLAPVLLQLGSNVRGIARSAGVRSPGVQIYSDKDLEAILSDTDALVMILPGDESTKHVINAKTLAMLPKHAVIVNVGRGTSIDEGALADALEQGSLGGAQLDVFQTEPLPENDRLFKMPNLFVSPHAAGGRPQGAEELIVGNLRRFLAGQELKNAL